MLSLKQCRQEDGNSTKMTIVRLIAIARTQTVLVRTTKIVEAYEK